MAAGATVSDEARVLAGSILVLNLGMGFPLGYILTTPWYRKKLNRTE